MSNFSSTPDSTASNADAVTPNDTTVVRYRALYVGVTGNVSVLTEGGQTVTFQNAQAGSVLPIRVARVRATGTTATNILGLY